MSFADNEHLLSEYVQWSAEKKVAGIDVSPAAFLIDKAKEQGMEKVIKAVEYLDEKIKWIAECDFESILIEGETVNDHKVIDYEDVVQQVRKILGD